MTTKSHQLSCNPRTQASLIQSGKLMPLLLFNSLKIKILIFFFFLNLIPANVFRKCLHQLNTWCSKKKKKNYIYYYGGALNLFDFAFHFRIKPSRYNVTTKLGRETEMVWIPLRPAWRNEEDHRFPTPPPAVCSSLQCAAAAACRFPFSWSKLHLAVTIGNQETRALSAWSWHELLPRMR